MKSSEKYIDLWTKHRESIKEALKKAANQPSIQLNSKEFNNAGNREKYRFNLEFINGDVRNSKPDRIHGSAVARDLIKVLLDSDEIKEILKSGHYKLNMDEDFYLSIERKD